MKRETRLVRSSRPGVSPAVDRSTTFPYDAGLTFAYSRRTNPTQLEAEALLAELDGGPSRLFPSGAGAVTAVLLGLFDPGTRVALPHDAYYGVALILEGELARFGYQAVPFDQTGPPPEDIDLVWLETPANPLLSFPDLDQIVAAAHARGAKVAVDATAATPILLRPLEHGVDVVVHSATKYLVGHSDALLGSVACAREEDAKRLEDFRTTMGIVAAPDPAWLLLRGLRTLDLRVRRQSETALELARRLAVHPAVERVRYPGLGDEVAARYMDGGFGGLLSFDVAGGGEAARRVETSTRVITNATSLGSVESLIETRHRWEGDRVPENLVRLSVGLEDVDDLWADLDQALTVET